MFKSVLLPACLMAIVLTGKSLPAQVEEEGATFRYKPQEKEKQLYRTTLSMKQLQTIGDQKISTTMKQTSVDKWTLEKIGRQGEMQYRKETEQLQVSLKVDPTGEYEFDSDGGGEENGSPLAEALNPVYELLSSASISVTMTPRGEIKEVSGYKDLVDDLVKDNPFGAQLAGGANDNAARLTLSDQFIVFDDKPVKAGDMWETEFNVDMQGIGKSKGKRIYKYEGPEMLGELATEKFSMSMEFSVDVNVKANGTTISGALSAEQASGTIHFDPDKGQIVQVKGSYTISGDINFSNKNNTQSISSSQTQSVERVLLDKASE